jgi:hypothetical protein
MPVHDEHDYLHVRIPLKSEEGKKLLRILSQTQRSAVTEVKLAIQQYKPQAIYTDNGK